MKVFLIHEKYLVDGEYYKADKVVAVTLRQEDTELAIQRVIAGYTEEALEDYEEYLEMSSPKAQEAQRQKALLNLETTLARCKVGSNRYKRFQSYVEAQKAGVMTNSVYPKEDWLKAHLPERDEFFVEEMETFSGE